MQEPIDYLRQADAVLAGVIDMVGPIEHVAEGGGFRVLVDAIVSQQISVQAANAIMGRLEAGLGGLEPARLLAADAEELRGLGLSRAKVSYLQDLAGRVTAGALDLDGLERLDDEAAIAALSAVRGIGRWSAEIYLMFALGRPDILPADDLGLRYAAQQFYELPEPPRPAALRAIGAAWSPYRSLASLYLWRGRRLRM